MRSSLLVLASALSFLACSGGSGTTPAPNPDGGSTGDGGSNTDGSTGSCSAAAPTVLVADFGRSISVHMIGNDVYWIDLREGFDHGSGVKSGVIKHIKTDGTGASTLVTPTFGTLLAIGVTDTDLYYFSENVDATNVFLYKSPRATGGEGTQLGTGAFVGLRVTEGVIYACPSCGVFGQSGTDIFVNDQKEISRVATGTGQKTVIATPQQAISASLVSGNVYYRDLATSAVFTVAANAASASATKVGTVGCGVTILNSTMGAFAGGFICGDLLSVDKLDLGATMKTKVYDSLTGNKNAVPYEPSAVDGTTYYISPYGSDALPIYKVDTGTNALTPAVCAAHGVMETAITATDFVYVDAVKAGMNVNYSLNRVGR